MNTGLGFDAVGSRAFFVDNPGDAPPAWSPIAAELPEPPPKTFVGLGATLVTGEHLHAYLPNEPDHDLFLLRWRLEDVERRDLGKPEWHGEEGWIADVSRARPVVRDVQTELSVHQQGDELWMVSVDGFGATNVVVRTASAPEGPWSEPRVLYRPPESDRSGVLVYSAKAHPHLSGGAPLITYCSNHEDFATLTSDMSLYFPRFIRPR